MELKLELAYERHGLSPKTGWPPPTVRSSRP